MPLPTPTPNESRNDFIDRCMGDEKVMEEFGDAAQRFAVCQVQWDEADDEPEMDDKKARWYAVAKDQNGVANIAIYDEIGGFGVTAKDFARSIKGLGDINLTINSPGGDVLDGLAIYNALKEHGGKVTVTVNTLAASMASIIALAGDEIKIADNGFFMIHNPWTVAGGDADYLEKTASDMRKFQSILEDIYFQRTKLNMEEVREMMSIETWLSAEESVEYGFADSIFKAEKPKAKASDFRGRIAARIFKAAAPTPSPANSKPKKGRTVMEGNDKLLEMQAKLTDAAASIKAHEKEVNDLKAQLQAAEKERVKALELVRKDAAAIIALGNAHGQIDLAVEAIANESTVEQFKDDLLNAYANWEEADEVDSFQGDLDANREPASRDEFLATYASLEGRAKSDYYGQYNKNFLK